MTFNPDSYDDVETKVEMIEKGEYLCICTDVVTRTMEATGNQLIELHFAIEQNYDEGLDRYIKWRFRLSYWLSEKAARYYAQFCKNLGVGAHDVEQMRTDEKDGLKDVWLNRTCVGVVAGKANGKYTDYRLYSPRQLNEDEKEAYSDLVIGEDFDPSEMPF